jgi:hypothetical protein
MRLPLIIFGSVDGATRVPTRPPADLFMITCARDALEILP